MNEYLVCGALIGIGMICLGTGLGIMVYYAHSIQKMEKILTNYQEGGKESLDAIKETRNPNWKAGCSTSLRRFPGRENGHLRSGIR